jgi:hypothetical protein
MRTRLFASVLAGALLLVAGTASATVSRDGQPTKLVKQARSLGITKAGEKYTFSEQENNSDTLFLTVDLPTAWSELADSNFIDPDTEEPYGVGLRATTDAEAFRSSFDVPGVRITAATLGPDEAELFDTEQAVSDNAYSGCRAKSIKPFDNGVYEGSYQLFDRCDGKRAAVVVDMVGRGVEILVAGQALTKADLAAIDRVLRSVKVERTST